MCDSDTEYLKMFQAYWQKKKPADFEIFTYDTLNQAVKASVDNSFEIFVVNEKIYDSNVIKVKAAKIFILQEDGVGDIKDYSIIVKYQSMENLISQILGEYASDNNCKSIMKCGKNKTKLISFYSPQRHIGQTIAALSSAKVMTDRGYKVLYINLLPFAGFEELLDINYEADITDFMYFVLNNSNKLLYKLESIKRVIQGIDYLPPATDFSDLMRINSDEWDKVVDILLYSSDYMCIVIDLSETCQGFYHILEKSDNIYILNDTTTILGNAMTSHYQNLLNLKEYTNILSKSKEFELPDKWETGSDILSLKTYMKRVIEFSE